MYINLGCEHISIDTQDEIFVVSRNMEIMKQRKIIHIDCDCFYAAVEERDNPKLKGLAVAVGGKADRRGVVATCNYKARAFGVHSAMASSRAFKLCPDLIMLPPRMEVYREVSRSMHEIFKHYTPLIEPLSLDEAYLDVTACTQNKGSATWIAQEIRSEVESKLGITVSAGIAPNKFLAKVASDWNKPNGQFVILPDQVDDFIAALPVKKIPGVGTVTNKKMASLEIYTCQDLQRLSQAELCQQFGKFGERLFDYARGKDIREVKTQRTRKSVSVETTFSQDIETLEEAELELPALIEKLELRMVKHSKKLKTLFVKVKFNDFTITNAESAWQLDMKKIFEILLETAYLRKNIPIRLIGIGIRFDLAENTSEKNMAAEQLSLFA